MNKRGTILLFLSALAALGLALATSYVTGLWPHDGELSEAAIAAATSPAWVDRLERVGTTGILIGGITALLLAFWRGDIAQRQMETVSRQFDIQRENHLDERYYKGAELLGHEKLALRLAGIQSLEQVATERPDTYHLPVVNLLCDFVRRPPSESDIDDRQLANRYSTWPASDNDAPEVSWDTMPVKLDCPGGWSILSEISGVEMQCRVDVEAAARCIGRNRNYKLEEERSYALDLYGADLRGAKLTGVDFSGAVLSEALLSFADCTRANFKGTNLKNADFDFGYLLGADLSHANLEGVSLRGATLFETDFTEAFADRANFSSPVELPDGALGTNLVQANFSNAVCRDANFSKAYLRKTNLSGASLVAADFTGAYLNEADLSGSRLEEARFAKADLSGTEFHRPGQKAAQGLLQAQTLHATFDGEKPPHFGGTRDQETREPLVWYGTLPEWGACGEG